MMSHSAALDAAEVATIRATRFLHEAACEQREAGADIASNLADARAELQRARWLLARASATGSASH
jgi:hypothetical protein